MGVNVNLFSVRGFSVPYFSVFRMQKYSQVLHSLARVAVKVFVTLETRHMKDVNNGYWLQSLVALLWRDFVLFIEKSRKIVEIN